MAAGEWGVWEAGVAGDWRAKGEGVANSVYRKGHFAVGGASEGLFGEGGGLGQGNIEFFA